MSIRIERTIWCDVCSLWENADANTAQKARKWAKKRGWVRRRQPGKRVLSDICPACAVRVVDGDA